MHYLIKDDNRNYEKYFLEALYKMYPEISENDLHFWGVSKARVVFALPTINYSKNIPGINTSLGNYYIINSAQIINGTLNVNETIQVAENKLKEILNRMAKKKPIASISLDLDNQWSYMKIHGDEGWDKYPSYFNIFVPHVLDVLDELDLKITFFIVGKDTESEENRKYLKMITERGHEVGNHSYHHESWLQTYSYEKIEKEIREAEEAIEKVTGQRTTGFQRTGL